MVRVGVKIEQHLLDEYHMNIYLSVHLVCTQVHICTGLQPRRKLSVVPAISKVCIILDAQTHVLTMADHPPKVPPGNRCFPASLSTIRRGQLSIARM